MAQPVVHFEINGRNGPALQKFYSDAFGWQIQNMPEMNYGMVEGVQGGIGGGIAQVESDEQKGVTIYVQVDDPQKYLDKLAGLGGSVVMPVTEIPNVVTFAVFADPEGNHVGLVKA
jgi:predicted enzyme related to lactoylglutathione lyase